MNFSRAIFCAVAALVSVFLQADEKTLISKITTDHIRVDGFSEAAWGAANQIEILVDEIPYEPNNGYEGIRKTKIIAKALYDDEYLYMTFQWKDPTKDLQRFPWEKQKNGSWKHLKNLDSTLHENTYYEDKAAVFWNINEKGFAKKGCDKSCHLIEEDGTLEGLKDTSSGRHYTIAGVIDEWQWKSTRQNVHYMMDDGYVDSEHNTNKKWGRHPDHKESGGYYNNFEGKVAVMPKWMSPAVVATAGTGKPLYHIVDSEKVPFEDVFEPGDRIPGIVTGPIIGSRADVNARGEWVDGVWTLEIKRKLITEDKADPVQDLQFDDLAKTYYWGVAVFDNAQIAHLHHTGSLKLQFEQ